jgi:hypothetical protein
MITSSRWRSVTLLAIPFIWLGCEGGGGPMTATVRDSAGITIVENAGSLWTEGEEWQVGDEPQLDIGVLEGDPAYQLYQARHALRLSDGTVVVANVGTSELRFYGPDGVHLKSVGREGGGPGEFESLSLVRRFPGDSLLTYDNNQSRVTIWSRDGTLGRSYRITPEGEIVFLLGEGVFADGTLLVKAPLIFRGGFSDGARRDEEEYQSFSTTGAFVDTVGVFAGPDQFIESHLSARQAYVSLTRPPFGREPVLAVHGDRLYYGSADSYEIRCHTQDGALTQIIRRAVEPRRVTPADVQRLIERELEDIEDPIDRRDARERYDKMPVAETMPAYAGLEVDDLGNMWVQEYDPESEGGRTYTVFDASGQMLGPVQLPAGLTATHIGDDFVLGVWRDDLDVEHVRLYRLTKE